VIKLTKKIIIVEGIVDRGAIKGIMYRLNKTAEIKQIRGNRPKKVISIAKNETYDLLIIMKDLHYYTENQILNIFNNIKQNLNVEIYKKIALIIVKHAIESWFLSDINNLNKIYNINITKDISNPENITKPDYELKEILRNKGKNYIKNEEIAKRIMIKADFDQIMRKCVSFKKFINYLNDC